MSDIKINFFRPERRFGWAAHIYRDNAFTGRREVWRTTEDGHELWEEVDSNAHTEPSLFFPDEVMDALAYAWREQRPEVEAPKVLDAIQDALSDARTVRDRLLSIVEK